VEKEKSSKLDSILQKRWLGIPALALATGLFFGVGVAIALAFNLSVSVPATVDIEDEGDGKTTSAIAYVDPGFSEELTNVNFGSATTAGGSLSTTVYVKPNEIDMTTVQATGVIAPYSLNVASVDQVTGAIQITLVIPPNQPTGLGISVGNVTLTGTGPIP
jgi:hypothetical protein